MNIHWLTYLGVCFIAFGTIFTFWGQQITSDIASKQLESKTDKVEILSQQNIKLSTEISDLNKKIASMVTGGDSYCHFLLHAPGNKSNILDLTLIGEGDYPVFDISVKIEDVDEMVKLVLQEQKAGHLPYDSLSLSNAMFAKASKVIFVGNLSPKTVLEMAGIQIPPGVDKKSYNISITARNGFVMQFVRLHRINHEWKMAVKTILNGKVIDETFDSGYPLNKEGKVDL